MRRWIRDHGLLLANAGLFAVFFVGMVLAGVRAYNGDQSAHHEPAVSLWGYLHTGDFVEATFENWESEFLQMGMYVVLTAYLFQRGSSESKPIDQPSPQDQDPRDADKRADVPWPVRRGGIVLALYERSLAGLFFVLFALSIALHAAGGARAYSAEQLAHGRAGGVGLVVRPDLAVLVRVVPELAVGVPRRGRHRRRLRVPAAARVRRVEAGRGAAPRHRRLSRPLPVGGCSGRAFGR